MKLTAFAALLVSVSAGTAFAQPGPDQGYDTEQPPATATQQVAVSGTIIVTPIATPVASASSAPMTDAWANVSHINGQVVPVGERGAYLLTQKKMNISTNPIGWMVGIYGVSGSYALSNNVAIRADVNVFSFENEQGYEYGLSLPIYFKRTYSGPFLEPGIAVRSLQSANVDQASCFDCGSYDMASDVTYGPEVMIGWHSTFDSGLNIAAAVGALRNMNPARGEYSDEVEPTGYFRVGYAF